MFDFINIMVRISNLDVVQMLMENSRMPYVEMAKILGVSETAVRKKVRKLEEAGVIKRYTVEADMRKLGYEIDALIGIDTKPEAFLSMLEKLQGMDEVIHLCSSSGDHMMMVECWFRNTGELTKFVKMLESMSGVTKVCPAIMLEKIK